jgi:hypothetical protein
MILASHFYDLLDCLAGQFFITRAARCVGNDFGVTISVNAKEYFSVVIIPERLIDNRVVLGVLLDDSAHIASRNGFTFVIYIDTDKINGSAFEIFSAIILAHEICHFSFYYELFIKLGDNTGIATHSNFTHAVSVTMMGAITEEEDSTSQTIFDEHDISDLARNMRRFPKRHFTKGKESKIDYQDFLDKFLDRLRFSEKIEEYKNQFP